MLYTSCIWTGLYELEAQGRLTLEVSLRPRPDLAEVNGLYKHPLNLCVFCMRVEDTATRTVRIVYIDLVDGEGIASAGGLAAADVYFKRSYREEFIQSRMLFPKFRRKIYPFGLFFPVISAHQHSELRRAVVAEVASGVPFRNPAESLWRIRQRIKGVLESRRHRNSEDDWSRNNKRDFEAAVEVPDKRQILFLTRTFDPEAKWNSDNREYVIALNEQRAKIIRSIRKYFGTRFVGSLISDAYAKANYPDCVATVSTVRADYLQPLRESRVAISTTGLMDSIPAKLAEYIAAARCVLSDPLRFELPFDIAHLHNALFFNSTDECIESSERLLSDDGLATHMRHENERLYRTHIEPSAAIWNCIQIAFAHAEAP